MTSISAEMDLVKDAADRAFEEACRGYDLHGPHPTVEHAHTVLREEFDELWDEIKRKDRDMTMIYREAIQVAAMALRLAAKVDFGK